MKKIKAVLLYNWKQTFTVIFGLFIFGFGYAHLWKKDNFFDSLWQWIDPVAGIMAFLITLTILYNQAREKWSNQLEKRLDVDFNYKGVSIAKVEGAYLAGESDIRQWAQQLGRQMMGLLDLDMNMEESGPYISREENGRYYKSFKLKIYLASNPLDIKKGKESLDKFLKEKDNYQHSIISGDIDNLPIKWKRKK